MEKNSRYVPDEGDIVWLTFTPQSGHEQAGRRPALILSPREYNGISGLCIICPITSKAKFFRFEVHITGKVKGVVQSDHVKSQDWIARDCTFIEKADSAVVAKVSEYIRLLLP